MTNVKVGVFLSECGGQLQETLNLESLVEFTKEIPDVVMVERNSEFWRGRGLKKIVDAVERGIINRVVVSEASPKLYGLKIIRAVEKAGLNPYLVEVIDLNGYCAIPHSDAPEEATEKAKAMLLAAIEKAKLKAEIEREKEAHKIAEEKARLEAKKAAIETARRKAEEKAKLEAELAKKEAERIAIEKETLSIVDNDVIAAT